MHIGKTSHIIKTSCCTHTFTTSSTHNIILLEHPLAINIIKSHHYSMPLIIKYNIIESCMWYRNFTDDLVIVISKYPHHMIESKLEPEYLTNLH